MPMHFKGLSLHILSPVLLAPCKLFVWERRLQKQSWGGAETRDFNKAERDTSMQMQSNDNQH